jgi:hypothetical protein
MACCLACLGWGWAGVARGSFISLSTGNDVVLRFELRALCFLGHISSPRKEPGMVEDEALTSQ